jgi:hypothetical protein
MLSANQQPPSRPGPSRYSALIAPRACNADSQVEEKNFTCRIQPQGQGRWFGGSENDPTMSLEERMLERLPANDKGAEKLRCSASKMRKN